MNPVLAARAVMERSPHVLLAGDGAERFAHEQGLPHAAPESFVTDLRRRQLARWRERSGAGPSDPGAQPAGGGTVGAVARDPRGHLAAATSTGGLTGKLPGRVSDSALIGAGSFADDATCAVSATGTGDAFIRAGFAHQVDALMRYTKLALAEACEQALASVHRAERERRLHRDRRRRPGRAALRHGVDGPRPDRSRRPAAPGATTRRASLRSGSPARAAALYRQDRQAQVIGDSGSPVPRW